MSDINTYIQQSRQKGLNDAQIKQELIKAGWNEEQVNQALSANQVRISTTKKATITVLIVLAFLIGGISAILFLFMAAFNDTGVWVGYIPLALIPIYLFLWIWLSLRSWKRKSIWPILILIFVFSVPFLWLFSLIFQIPKHSQADDTARAEKNAPLMQRMLAAKRDFVCIDPYSDEKFIYINKAEGKVEQMFANKKIDYYSISTIGAINSSDEIELTSRWSGIRECRNENGLSIFDVYKVNTVN
jgi:hypothetical protein